MSGRKFRAIMPFTPEFVADVGVDRLHEFIATPDGARPASITATRKLTDLEVRQFHVGAEIPDNCEFWLFEGEAEES